MRSARGSRNVVAETLAFGAAVAMVVVIGTASVQNTALAVSAPPPVVAPPYFDNEPGLLLCGYWVRQELRIYSDDATCPCRRNTPQGGGCDQLPVTVWGHPNESLNGQYWKLRIQRCEESSIGISDDASGTFTNSGAFKLSAVSGVYQNPVPGWKYDVIDVIDIPWIGKVATDPMACCPDCIGDSESFGGPCHVQGKLSRAVRHYPPPDGIPDTMQYWMRITASATIKLDARLHRLGCVGSGSATVSGRSEVDLQQNLTAADVGIDRKFPAVIAGERTFDFSGAATTGTAGFTLKLGVNPEVEIGSSGSSTIPSDGNLRIVARSEKVDWESRRFCMSPPTVPAGGPPYAEFLVEMSGEVISRALLATGREAECKTQVHLHNVDVSSSECTQCFASTPPDGPTQHNP